MNRPAIVVVGLGPAGPELTSPAAAAALAAVDVRWRFVRTRRHPAAEPIAAAGATAFDDVYEGADTLDDVYAQIVERLLSAATEAATGAATEAQPVVYAVPGSPLVAERTVEFLREFAVDRDVALEVVPSMSFLDLAWARLGIDPVAAGVRLVDGHRFDVEAAGERGPLLVAQCDHRDVLSAIKLAFDDEPPTTALVLQRLGLPDERVVHVDWAELDRTISADHLTTLWLPDVAAPVGRELMRFWDLARTLRERCPWDREQTHDSLTRYLVEETYETIEAIDSGDPDHLVEELGDLLYQVYFHAVLGAEAGEFTIADVARGIHDKLYDRHPHVFGDVTAESADEVLSSWEANKAKEKGRDSVMDGIPRSLPALLLAQKIGKKAASVGFDWGPGDLGGVYAKVAEELAELRADGSADELGDVLFAVVNVARHLGHDPESALRAASDKFARRFREMERLVAASGRTVAHLTPSEADALWEDAKRTAAPPTSQP